MKKLVEAAIEALIEALIEREGDYVDHPLDRGGPTRWGITEQVARAFQYLGPMRDLSKPEARQIYAIRYWVRPGFDWISARDQALALELFDCGVNMGPVWPGRFLQRALNALNRSAGAYPDIAVDGGIGPMTLAALDKFAAQRGVEGLRVLTAMCNAQQSVRYLDISEADPSQEAFAYGWQLNRVVKPLE